MNTQPDGVSAMSAELGAWRPMATAPTDGECVLLLIDNPDHPLEDENPAISLGSYGVFGGPEEDPHWCFAGWDWSFDSYRRGEGTPIGWMPLPSRLAPNTEGQRAP
jgi:hypothetical protein